MLPAKVRAFADMVAKEARAHIARQVALLPHEAPGLAGASSVLGEVNAAGHDALPEND